MLVLDKRGRPLQPCTPARARKLLAASPAVVHRHTPFVIRLKDRTVGESEILGVEVGVDPGSKATGVGVFIAQADVRTGLLAGILRQAKTPLRDAAAASSTRWALWRALTGTGLPVAVATGGRTKWNRHRTGAPKTHTLDALHTGALDTVTRWPDTALVATSTGRGSHARTRSDRYGFPRLRLPRTKQVHGFATGDLVHAVVPTGVERGTHTGRVAVRSTGRFNIRTGASLVQGIHHRHIRLLQRADGWAYTRQPEGAPTHA
ncbi:RRXRR domain-containing protein [Actinoplanes hulinensis]|uniref:RRXRR domain-containing protein n=1 Tax=Actinoplanes hulinensis TaxID=1144547 RepID=A0ABS7B5W0_9ACTN|nr:RRXRR domain-containing protein [Actinoplanes hulinensis]MBW6436041.1 RRXRR domain-containing protein [Actinoplanes hulinensis]